jgi:dTDP-4-amino-4,6-dideoxygalactose transaminase
MFVTDDEELYESAKQLWCFGETRTPLEDRDYHAYALGWMYRMSDLTAAFGRAQLTKLDHYLAVQKENSLRLTECLTGVPYLILPGEPDGHEHNWYNYTIRFDMEAIGHKHDAAAFRDRLLRALQAEGVETIVWQSFILPAMTVFQARNGYGKGCPWSCSHAGEVDYSPEQFPAAQKHCDWHIGMTTPTRAPNGRDIAELVGEAISKVMANLDQLEESE